MAYADDKMSGRYKIPDNLRAYIIDKSELKLGEYLGEGFFGQVSKGKFRGEEVAVKVLMQGNKRDLENEASTLARFDHPNVVRFKGVCLNAEKLMLVTEFMCGGSLDRYLGDNVNRRRFWKMGGAYLFDISQQVCQGMVYLESMRYVHGDLHLGNCLIGSHNQVKVADFGFTTIPSMQVHISHDEKLRKKAGDVEAFGRLVENAIELGWRGHLKCDPQICGSFPCPNEICPVISECMEPSTGTSRQTFVNILRMINKIMS